MTSDCLKAVLTVRYRVRKSLLTVSRHLSRLLVVQHGDDFHTATCMYVLFQPLISLHRSSNGPNSQIPEYNIMRCGTCALWDLWD